MTQKVLTLNEAYDYCKDLTSKRESNFALGFPFLPPDKEKAIYVVYAFCRFVDDISDEVGTGDVTQMLRRWTDELDNVYIHQKATHPISMALLDTLKTFKIPRDGFDELIDGCVNDQSIKHYQTFKDLSGYCEYVATSIAKVSLPVYGYKKDPRVAIYGKDLSYAFQLTNILRDIAPDYAIGRVYIPQAELNQFSLTLDDIINHHKPQAILDFYEFQGKRVQKYFAGGVKVIPFLDRDSQACVSIMEKVYHTLLDKILANPLLSLGQETVLSIDEKESITKEFLA